MPEMKRQNPIAQAWLVILLALAYGGGLAGVHMWLGEKITENRRNETFSVIPDIVPGADRGMTEEMFVNLESGKEVRLYRARATDGSTVGWVLPSYGQGFADRIELLVGVNEDVSQITGMYVLNQKETPGLGDYITGEEWRSLFEGRPADQPLEAVKREAAAENEIKALTGATISSESVCNIVNKAVADYTAPIQNLRQAEQNQ